MFWVFYLMITATLLFPGKIEWYHTNRYYVVEKKEHAKFDGEEKYIFTHHEECQEIKESVCKNVYDSTIEGQEYQAFDRTILYDSLVFVWFIIFVLFCASYNVFIL